MANTTIIRHSLSSSRRSIGADSDRGFLRDSLTAEFVFDDHANHDISII
ncbi:hypothetical protein RRSWK_06999 [Rhodopirellula sp. SWK7]|nr:hypothetical protein RRSWK_06999 [Rhodopirellula sp. SWK7]